MNRIRPRCQITALVAGLSLASQSAMALISINEGRDKFFVAGNVSTSWNSNIDANEYGSGDFITTAGVIASYTRRAGVFGVDASVGMTLFRFADNQKNNSDNPSFNVEVTKSSGRTTGSLGVNVKKDNSTDTSANLRAVSWNYGANLGVNYPVIERYSLSGGLGYSCQDFTDNSQLVDVKSASASTDLFYVLNSQRDIFSGYRYRRDITTGVSRYGDHDFHIGTKGRLFPKLHGSASVGYQFRQGSGTLSERFNAWSASVAATWSINKRSNLSLGLGKDFHTTASDETADQENVSLRAGYTLNSRWSAGLSAGAGHNRFLGVRSKGREDTFVTWGADMNYSVNEHLKASCGYSYRENWSTLKYADYISHSVSLNLSSSW